MSQRSCVTSSVGGGDVAEVQVGPSIRHISWSGAKRVCTVNIRLDKSAGQTV